MAQRCTVGVVDENAAILHHFFDMSQAQRVPGHFLRRWCMQRHVDRAQGG